MAKTKKRGLKGNKKRLVAFSILIILAVTILLVINLSKKNVFESKCNNLNTCKDCLVTISCLNIVESENASYASFTIKNQNKIEGDCIVNIITEKNSSIINNSYELGILKSNQQKDFETNLIVYDGYSITKIEPSCKWGQ